uniref:PH01B001G05.20 protein n=1 Tax=Phyllostachys edulis TaxID=38705 RepID=L0P2C7_PHYED|nr:PH01B001G05.20 [Phyllostachys edulis]
MTFLGAPDTRPEEDYCVVNSYPQLDRARQDWEATTLVAWVLKGDANADDRAVAEAVRRCFGLRREDVDVSLHHPETFLLKFVSKHTRDRVREAKKFQHDTLEIHVRPWRAGDVVEQVVGRKCSLHSIEGVSASREDTRTLNLWAWMANPSSIPKVAWITFTSPGPDSSRPKASSRLPDKWRRGLTHRVIIHRDYVEDHTTAPLDNFISVAETAAYEPITTSLPWNLGAVDGTPESKGGPSHLPSHPLRQDEKAEENLEAEAHRDSRGQRCLSHRGALDDHPTIMNRRHKDDDDRDDDKDRHNRPSYRSYRSTGIPCCKRRLKAIGCVKPRITSWLLPGPQKDSMERSLLSANILEPDQGSTKEALQDVLQGSAPMGRSMTPSLGPHLTKAVSHLQTSTWGSQLPPNQVLISPELPPPVGNSTREIEKWQGLKEMLFSTPSPPILAAPAPTNRSRTPGPALTAPQTFGSRTPGPALNASQTNGSRTPGRFSLRRSTRLAAKRKPISMLQRAQEALAQKMGTLPTDQPLTEEALRDYLSSFDAPLPHDTIVALS